MRLSRRENKFYRRGWLFERFQQSIERILGDLMNFIDDIDFEPALGWLVADVFYNLANLIDATIRSAVDFKDVDGLALGALFTVRALITRSRRRPLLAIQCFGQNARGGSLADPPHSSEQKSMRDALCSNGVL